MLNNQVNDYTREIKYKNTYVFWIACAISSLIISAIVIGLAYLTIGLFENFAYKIITVFLSAILWSNLLSKFIIAAHKVYADRYQYTHDRSY